MSDIDINKLDRLYEEAADGTWVPTAEKDRFSSSMFDAYPALSARLRELEGKDAERGGCEQCKPLIRALDNEIEGAMDDAARRARLISHPTR